MSLDKDLSSATAEDTVSSNDMKEFAAVTIPSRYNALIFNGIVFEL
jgi:hypothetical protein